MNDFLSFAIPAIVVGGFIRFVLLKKMSVSTPSLAAVMAAGIFLFASLPKISWLFPYSKILSVILFSTWFWICASIVWTVINGTFYKMHLSHPIKLFAIGTWIAGTSVLANVIGKYFMDIELLLQVIAVFNLILWVSYILVCIRAYRQILKSNLKNNVHGVLLLATVSTQSIVLLYNNKPYEYPQPQDPSENSWKCIRRSACKAGNGNGSMKNTVCIRPIIFNRPIPA